MKYYMSNKRTCEEIKRDRKKIENEKMGKWEEFIRKWEKQVMIQNLLLLLLRMNWHSSSFHQQTCWRETTKKW